MVQRFRCFSSFQILLSIGIGIAGAGISNPSWGQSNPIILDVPAPELTGSAWINTPKNTPLKLASRKGKITIVHFWTFGCINCKHNLPVYARWQKQFAKRGVEIIGVHTPETDEEKITSNVSREVKHLGITYPVLIDKNGLNWNKWKQQFWPTVYLIDKSGHVRAYWEGELEWENSGGEAKMADIIDSLLKEQVKQ